MTKKQAISTRRVASRRQLSRWERERKLQRTFIIAGVVAIILILAIPLIGWYKVFFVPPREPVIKVNDTVFDMGYYLKRLRLLYEGSKAMAASGQANLGTVPFELLEILEDNELVRQGAPKLNVGITPEEVDQELRRRVQPTPASGEDVDKAQLEAEFSQLYRQRLNDLRLSDKEYREIVEVDLLRDKLREQLGTQVPAIAEQVHIQAILVETEEKAKEAANRLRKGEDFTAVSKEVSTSESLKEKEGDMGWLPRGVMSDAFDKETFSLQPGTVSEPFSTPDGYYILKVQEKAEARRIDNEPRERLKDKAFQSWLDAEKKLNKVERYFDSDKYEWAMSKLREFEKGPTGKEPSGGQGGSGG